MEGGLAMFTPAEREEIRQCVHREMAHLEAKLHHDAGSYNYLCSVGGLDVFTHRPLGAVLHTIAHAR
jgi:hypothetical protein